MVQIAESCQAAGPRAARSSPVAWFAMAIAAALLWSDHAMALLSSSIGRSAAGARDQDDADLGIEFDAVQSIHDSEQQRVAERSLSGRFIRRRVAGPWSSRVRIADLT